MPEFDPRRPAVIALPRTRRHFHLPKKRIHLRDGQDTSSTNGPVARNGRGNMVELVAKAHRAAKLGDLGGKIDNEMDGISLAKSRRHGPHQHRGRTETFKLETHAIKLPGGRFE